MMSFDGHRPDCAAVLKISSGNLAVVMNANG